MSIKKFDVDKEKIKEYWEVRSPQTRYSNETPGSLPYYKQMETKRYKRFYRYLFDAGEFINHPKEKVLEIGVGQGTDLLQYAKNGSICFGIDLTQNAIDRTTERFALYGLDAELSTGDAENLNFPDNTFDLVYSFGVLHHTPHTDKAISEVYRVLKPGGKTIIMLYAKGWRHYWERLFLAGLIKGQIFRMSKQEVINKNTEVLGDSPLTYLFSKKDIKEMFSEFDNVSLTKYRLGPHFDFSPRYSKWKFPETIVRIWRAMLLERVIGENWIIKARKKTDSVPSE